MVKVKTETGKKVNCGFQIEYERISFRMKNLDEVMKMASEWMKSKYGDRFLGFENRPEIFGWDYVARIKDALEDDTHLHDRCVIGSTGKQWTVSLYHEKTVGYKCGI